MRGGGGQFDPPLDVQGLINIFCKLINVARDL